MQNTKNNTFAIVIPGFSDSESDIRIDTRSISSDMLDISNRKTDILGLSRICDNWLP